MLSAPELPPSSARSDDVSALVDLLRGRRFVALTGAGCSTESGIPDYRGEGTARRARNPIQHRAYVSDSAMRTRYWARSMLGWPRFSGALPNAAHVALAELERAGALAGLITQNVDRLHTAAGSQQVIELHGALHDVRCLHCGAIEARRQLQERLEVLNPGWLDRDVELNPDGDAELSDASLASFRVAACLACDGVLKPDVVFFGEAVPRQRVERAFELLDGADALLVIGSSLTVFSGYRFVRRAAERAMPIAVVNLGATRGDPLAALRIHGSAGAVLRRLERALAAV